MAQNEEQETLPVAGEPQSGEFPESHLEREDTVGVEQRRRVIGSYCY